MILQLKLYFIFKLQKSLTYCLRSIYNLKKNHQDHKDKETLLTFYIQFKILNNLIY